MMAQQQQEGYSRSVRQQQSSGGFAQGQYRSRSELGSPRRYASQTLLDGARPGPTTPHSRRDALQELQRELDSLASRSHAGGTSREAQQQAAAASRSYEYGEPFC